MRTLQSVLKKAFGTHSGREWLFALKPFARVKFSATRWRNIAPGPCHHVKEVNIGRPYCDRDIRLSVSGVHKPVQIPRQTRDLFLQREQTRKIAGSGLIGKIIAVNDRPGQAVVLE
ncbi:hypothetical protein RRG08_012975 [Elysia crispata]|uniref:Uncharacterized protein n=1 Tax=Elysia crispata TaxID=231223 RepID=A0AAE1A0K2_9GAST|nr:hypothetical protein RRG08_012975 [Elysia crispata]